MSSFKLASEKKEIELTYVTNPTEEEVAKYLQTGLSPIKHRSGYFFVNMKDQYMQDRLKNALGVPHYEVFHETTGRQNWILYNPKQYNLEYNREDKYILRFNCHKYDGEPLEMPINASSMCSMFSWMTLPDNLVFHKNWNTEDIFDASTMFAGAIYPENFSLDKFNFSSVINARYMFFGNTIKSPNFFKKFNAPNIISAECMFANATFCNDIDLNLTMDITTVMDKMFFNAIFAGKANLGDNFKMNSLVSTKDMFLQAYRDTIPLANMNILDTIEFLKKDIAPEQESEPLIENNSEENQ